jgi:hypothetical protein
LVSSPITDLTKQQLENPFRAKKVENGFYCFAQAEAHEIKKWNKIKS